MSEHVMAGLALILLLGIAAQLIGWLTRLPSILILIAAGILAGPVFGWLNPQELLGDLLQPFVSLAVAIVLFEGGLNLKISEIRKTAPVVVKLITLGVIITWVIASLGGIWILSLDWRLAILLGAILVISGPTVIMPLLRHLRLRGDIGPILKWEGILIDPIGATLALLVFGFILASGLQEALAQDIVILVKIVSIGVILGGLGALVIIQLLRRYLIPDFLQVPVVLSLVIGIFLVSGLLQQDAGLFTAVIMGAVLANQKQVSIGHIITFKETLGLILISLLFITLSATIDLSSIIPLIGPILGFSLLLIFVARPVAVYIASRGTKLGWKNYALLASIAPRGIVSASVASIFAFRLAENGIEGAEIILPITFAVIIVTVISSSILATVTTRKLDISDPNPQGIVFVGGQVWVRDIATALEKAGIPTLIIDKSKSNVAYARRKDLKAYYGDALSADIIDEVDLSGYGNILAMTSDDNVNHLAALQFGKEFGSSHTYLLPPADMPTSKFEKHVGLHLPGRVLFNNKANYDYLNEMYVNGARIKTVEITEKTPYKAFLKENKDAVPIFKISAKDNELTVVTPETKFEEPETFKLINLLPSLLD